MLHQRHIIGVIAADFFQAIGKFLALREKLFEAGKTTIHRVAPRIDDFRIRQDEMDKPDMAEIIRHFIGKERSALAVQPRLVDEIAAHLGKFLAGQSVQIRGISDSITIAALFAA